MTARSVVIVSAGGESLAAMRGLDGWWRDLDRVWVVDDTAEARAFLEVRSAEGRPAEEPTEEVVWADLRRVATTTLAVRRAVARIDARLVVASGPVAGLPGVLGARLAGARTLLVEDVGASSVPTRTGRLLDALADEVVVQAPHQLRAHRDARLVGSLL